jgi:hypothetical protein
MKCKSTLILARRRYYRQELIVRNKYSNGMTVAPKE